MSPEVATIVAGIFGAFISVGLVVIPGVKEWWASKKKYQREITLAFFLLAPFAIYGLSCSGLDYQNVICPPGAFTSVAFYYEAIKTGISAFVGSQVAYAGIKRTQS